MAGGAVDAGARKYGVHRRLIREALASSVPRPRKTPVRPSPPRLCAAIVERLTFNGTIIETGTESYRLAQTKAKQQARK